MARELVVLIESGQRSGPRSVQAARRLGFHPVLLARDPARFDYIAAFDLEVVQVDTSDARAVLDACNRLNLAGEIVGVTTVSESFISMVAVVCRHLGLPGPNPDSINRCRDKFVQRQILTDAGVPTPEYRMATNVADAVKFANEIGLPVVLKPVTGRGSSGVRLCRSADEVVERTEFLLAGKQYMPSPPRVLIEEFAVGPFCCVETLSNEAVGVTGADFGELPFFTYCGFTFPAQITVETGDRAIAVAKDALRALSLDWGPVNTELRLTERGPVVVEVNPRMTGAVVPDLISLAYGVDITAEAIKLATGGIPDLCKVRTHHAAVRYLIPECDGVLGEISGVESALNTPDIVDVVLSARAGDQVFRRGDTRDHLGYVVAASPDVDRTKAALRRACDLIKMPVTAPSVRREVADEAKVPAQ